MACAKRRANGCAARCSHGLGRHSPDEIALLSAKSLASLSGTLGDKDYLMGREPCGADATMFGMLAGILTPFFETALRDAALRHGNLVSYGERLMQRFYPAFGVKAA